MSASSFPKSVRLRGWTPRVGWFLAALAFLAWPIAFLHDATTVHAVCPEHGDVVDVAGAPAAADAEHAHEDGPRVQPGSPGEEEHGHCPFVLLAQPKQATGAQPDAVRLLLARLESAVRACEPRHASVPLLLLAPKQSPPV